MCSEHTKLHIIPNAINQRPSLLDAVSYAVNKASTY